MSQDFLVVFALYPGVTQLDFTGPYEVLSRLPGARCVAASTTGQAIVMPQGLRFDGLVRLAEVRDCALLCVPGGHGCVQAMGDAEFLGELRRLAAGARYVSSVCTGSLLLGAAGLLQGRRAACHWAWREGLRAFGAIPDEARVVRDGNLFSGGGVTAGIDLALSLMAEVAGEDYAQQVQLALEYAPQPPFDSGRPERAPTQVLQAVQAGMQAQRAAREAAIAGAAQRLRSALDRARVVAAPRLG